MSENPPFTQSRTSFRNRKIKFCSVSVGCDGEFRSNSHVVDGDSPSESDGDLRWLNYRGFPDISISNFRAYVRI